MKVSFFTSPHKEARALTQELQKAFGKTAPQKADIIVALGGDGLMLQCLHEYIDKKYTAKIYGMNMGTVGFLMNGLSKKASLLEKKLAQSSTTHLHPLRAEIVCENKTKKNLLAINEVALLRQSSQTAHLQISVDGRVRLEKLFADGVLLATAAGSTAYNFSAGGPIIPISAELLALTPISSFRPRHWRGGLLPSGARVRFDVLDRPKRSVSATADNAEIRNVASVEIWEDKAITLPLLFDKGHALEERIISEQFASNF